MGVSNLSISQILSETMARQMLSFNFGVNKKHVLKNICLFTEHLLSLPHIRHGPKLIVYVILSSVGRKYVRQSTGASGFSV